MQRVLDDDVTISDRACVFVIGGDVTFRATLDAVRCLFAHVFVEMSLHRAVALLLLTHLLSATANTYTNKGPFAYNRLKWKHGVPSGQNDRDMHMLSFTITYPLAPATHKTSADTSYPLIFFLSGFEMRASYYAPYVHQLASWGYVIVQYDVPLLPILTDRAHVRVANTVE